MSTNAGKSAYCNPPLAESEGGDAVEGGEEGAIIRALTVDRSRIRDEMAVSSQSEISQLLLDWRDGDKTALDKLIPLVHQELKRPARYHMRRERAGHTLQTSALVNEAYMRLVDYKRMRAQDRAHFLALAAQAMRRILVERARSHAREKRGGEARKVSLDEAATLAGEQAADIVALDDALTGLATFDPRKSQIVELRYLGSQHPRDRGSHRRVAGYRETRMEHGEDLASQGNHRSYKRAVTRNESIREGPFTTAL